MNQRQKDFLQKVILIVFIMIIIVNLNKMINRSYIILSDLPEEDIYLNKTGKKLLVERKKNKDVVLKKKLASGTYLLFYDEEPDKRWYAVLDKKGKKEISTLNFVRHKLPGIFKQLILPEVPGKEGAELANKSWRYSIFDADDNEIFYLTEINFALRGKNTNGSYVYTINWRFDINGSQKSLEKITIDSQENLRYRLFEDKLHQIDVIINTENGTASFELKAEFLVNRTSV